jgi:phosphoenolpyruvate-protein kinase (PTS system EI component)
VIVARDLAPADIVELRLGNDSTKGVALAAGSAVSHAAIMARALELPLVVGLGDDLLEVKNGDAIRLDGDRGEVIIDTGGDTAVLLHKAAKARDQRHESMRGSGRPQPVTRDGHRVRLLCNAASVGEVVAGLDGGAEGIGLLRTEFAFLRSSSWPTRHEHEVVLRPMLDLAHGIVATVRTLDFGADKLPPFLAGTTDRGLALVLAHPEALREQLRAILMAGVGTRLRVLFPFVKSVDEIREARLLLSDVAREIDRDRATPLVGAMIETREAATTVDEIAAASDFLAIGTNDVVRNLLEPDCLLPTSLQSVADPRVLNVVSSIVETGRARGLPVEICGEAVGDPLVLPLLIGLGVQEFSVAPSRLELVGNIIHSLNVSEASVGARSALIAASLDEALAVAAGLLASAQRG